MWPFRDSKDAIPTFTVENTVAAGSRVHGDVSGPGGFRIDGAIEGALSADGPVIVGEGGAVDGDIRGRDVTILGSVRGSVVALGHLEIGPKGRVLGDITVQSFRMHTGGVFRGTSRMGDDEAVPALGVFSVVGERPRGRTLPPPNGAVPPPAMLTEPGLGVSPVADDVASQQRLISSLSDTDAKSTATGT